MTMSQSRCIPACPWRQERAPARRWWWGADWTASSGAGSASQSSPSPATYREVVSLTRALVFQAPVLDWWGYIAILYYYTEITNWAPDSHWSFGVRWELENYKLSYKHTYWRAINWARVELLMNYGLTDEFELGENYTLSYAECTKLQNWAGISESQTELLG
jgi:hypothetical protein